jgi:hypothetical protein
MWPEPGFDYVSKAVGVDEKIVWTIADRLSQRLHRPALGVQIKKNVRYAMIFLSTASAFVASDNSARAAR